MEEARGSNERKISFLLKIPAGPPFYSYNNLTPFLNQIRVIWAKKILKEQDSGCSAKSLLFSSYVGLNRKIAAIPPKTRHNCSPSSVSVVIISTVVPLILASSANSSITVIK